MYGLVRLLLALVLGMVSLPAQAQQSRTPDAAGEVVEALKSANWQERQDGLSVLRAITQQGLVLTSYRISQELFSLELVVDGNREGGQVRTVGEQNGAIIAVNGGFFAQNDNGLVYSVGYLRHDGQTISRGWSRAGGLIEFKEDGIRLSPSYKGIPKNKHDVLQSKPMILEPGGVWAMGTNSGASKPRTLLCTLANGDIVLTVVSRGGLSLYEAGWLLRSSEEGGFFGCDAAIALDGGRSTQLWDADDPSYSYAGLSPVHNFLIVRSKRR